MGSPAKHSLAIILAHTKKEERSLSSLVIVVFSFASAIVVVVFLFFFAVIVIIFAAIVIIVVSAAVQKIPEIKALDIVKYVFIGFPQGIHFCPYLIGVEVGYFRIIGLPFLRRSRRSRVQGFLQLVDSGLQCIFILRCQLIGIPVDIFVDLMNQLICFGCQLFPLIFGLKAPGIYCCSCSSVSF